ncbi:MAG TPA: hypothetical protein VL691_02815 [Vicinamibacteria bacterium]|nr:hypothetical protein [Vicinamibacteria bacterium]
MTSQDIRAYMARDWAAVRDAKDAYWAERVGRLGPAEGLRIAEELRRQAQLLNPAWPSEDDRREDFLAHVRLRSLLDRARLPGRG